jgi:hypothetical protein
MMFLLEEIGVEAAMIIATLTAAAVFVWAAGTMLVRWSRFVRSERLANGTVAPERARAATQASRVTGPSL